LLIEQKISARRVRSKDDKELWSSSKYLNPVKQCWKRCEYWAAEVAGDLRLQASDFPVPKAWMHFGSKYTMVFVC
jgi:hypothetical protein